MAYLIDVDPSNMKVFEAVRRVVVWKGDIQLAEEPSEAATARLVISVLGSATIEACSEEETSRFKLDLPTTALLVAPGTTLQLESRSHDSVLLVVEEASD